MYMYILECPPLEDRGSTVHVLLHLKLYYMYMYSVHVLYVQYIVIIPVTVLYIADISWPS